MSLIRNVTLSETRIHNNYFFNNILIDMCRRILNIMIKPGISSKIVSLAMVSGDTLAATSSCPYLWPKALKLSQAGLFFMVRITAHSQLITSAENSNYRSYQITVTPLKQTWSHIVANISVGLQLGDKLIFQSFKDGISFSTLPTSKSFNFTI